MTQGQQAPDYDRSGRFPIDENGWQVIDLWRDLYAGGPWALRILAPEYPTFHAGWRFAETTDGAPESRVVISHIGARLTASDFPEVGFAPAAVDRIQERLRIYAMRNAVPLFGRPITGVDFVADDLRIEIF